jgi:hypothetical protein
MNNRRLLWFLVTLSALIIGGSFTIGAGILTPRNEFMKVEDAGRRWGKKKFDSKVFKTANSVERAGMTFDLIESKKYIDGSVDDVIRDLGEPDGHYFSESIPAYIIGEMSIKPTEMWQIVFIPSNDGKVVKQVRVHKKCCYSQKHGT